MVQYRPVKPSLRDAARCTSAANRATVLRSKRILVMLQERLEMDEEFAHGGDDGAFVGFAARDEALDVLANDGVVLCRALGGHVQTAAHLGASAADGTFAFPLAAITIPRGQPGQSDELVAMPIGGRDLAEVGQQTPRGDRANAGH